MHHKALLLSSSRVHRALLSLRILGKQLCIVQSESQRQSRIHSDTTASAGCTAASLDYELIESIIFQQHLRAASAPAMPEEDDKVRCLVRWPSSRSSIDEPSVRRDSMWHAPAPLHGVSPRSSPVRFQNLDFSAKVENRPMMSAARNLAGSFWSVD